VDVLLRQLSHGAKSIDDFARAFHGGSGGAPAVKPYTLDDLVTTLKAVQPYDWAAFFRDRVESVESRAPLSGIEKGGWKLIYTDKRSDYWTALEDEHKVADLTFSLGMTVRNEGGVADVVIGGPVHKSGIAPGAKVTSVNGRQFTAALLREAVQGAAADRDDPIDLQVKNGEYFSMHRVDYHGGEKYPHLERDNGKPDLLTEILQPRVSK
jgi:predicted metalloprotease with PDZ domain